MALNDDLIHDLTFRPKCYISIGWMPGTITREDIKDPAKLSKKISAMASSGFTELGAVQTLEINSTREVHVWRELDYATAGKPVESYPGLPSYELSLERIVLYKDNLLEAFNFDGYDIIKQNRPLTIKVTMHDPEQKNDRVWFIYGVWFKSNPMEFSVTDVGDLRIIQEVDAVAAGIVAAPRIS